MRVFFIFSVLMMLISCKKDRLTWNEQANDDVQSIKFPKDYTGINTIDSFWFSATYEGPNGRLSDTVVWYWLDSIVVGNNVYYPLSTNIPFVKEAVIGHELQLFFPESDNGKLQFRSIASSKLTCFDFNNVKYPYVDTFFSWVAIGSIRINAFHYSPLGTYHYGNEDYYSIHTSFDSLNVNAPTTFHRSMTWVDSLGIVELNYYRISRLLADTVERIKMDRIFK